MANYHKGNVPDQLDPQMRQLMLQRERFLRTLQNPVVPPVPLPDPDKPETPPEKSAEWEAGSIKLYSGSSTINDFPVPVAGTEILLRFADSPTVTSGGNLILDHDFVPVDKDSVLRLMSDGQYLREVGRSADSITALGTLACPVLVQGDCDHTFRVNTALGTLDFRVNTNQRFTQIGTQAGLIIGQANAGDTAYAGYGLFSYHQGKMQFTEAGTGASWFFASDGGQVVWSDGAVWPTEVSVATVPHGQTFKTSVGMLGGLALGQVTVTGNYQMLVSEISAHYTGAGNHTITLPPTVTTFAGAGVKPGSIVTVKDATTPPGLLFINQILVAPVSGTIDGAADVTLQENAGIMLQTDGTNWFQLI